MIKIIARIVARPGSETPLQAILQRLALASRGEAGCRSYELFQDEDDPPTFVTHEQWADQAAADAHMATAHVAEAIAQAGSLLAQAPLIHRFRQLA